MRWLAMSLKYCMCAIPKLMAQALYSVCLSVLLHWGRTPACCRRNDWLPLWDDPKFEICCPEELEPKELRLFICGPVLLAKASPLTVGPWAMLLGPWAMLLGTWAMLLGPWSMLLWLVPAFGGAGPSTSLMRLSRRDGAWGWTEGQTAWKKKKSNKGDIRLLRMSV